MAERQPVLFISHGAPTTPIWPGDFGPSLEELGSKLSTPDAILIVSAHWDSEIPTVSSASNPPTIHDFYGFPEPLYRIRYPAPGSPQLANQIAKLLNASGFQTASSDQRGLDHGAWVPLLFLFPEAKIPTLQLSLQSHQGPRHHFELGQALQNLPSENILVIGSGSLTHNLMDLGPRESKDTDPHIFAFRDWIYEKIAQKDMDSLLDYRQLAPFAVQCHPTEEHLLPLFFALGAAGPDFNSVRFLDEITYKNLAMDSYSLISQ